MNWKLIFAVFAILVLNAGGVVMGIGAGQGNITLFHTAFYALANCIGTPLILTGIGR